MRGYLQELAPHVDGAALWVFDRGFDGDTYMRVLDDSALCWAVRQNGNRDVRRSGVQFPKVAPPDRLAPPRAVWHPRRDPMFRSCPLRAPTVSAAVAASLLMACATPPPPEVRFRPYSATQRLPPSVSQAMQYYEGDVATISGAGAIDVGTIHVAFGPNASIEECDAHAAIEAAQAGGTHFIAQEQEMQAAGTITGPADPNGLPSALPSGTDWTRGYGPSATAIVRRPAGTYHVMRVSAERWEALPEALRPFGFGAAIPALRGRMRLEVQRLARRSLDQDAEFTSWERAARGAIETVSVDARDAKRADVDRLAADAGARESAITDLLRAAQGRLDVGDLGTASDLLVRARASIEEYRVFVGALGGGGDAAGAPRSSTTPSRNEAP